VEDAKKKIVNREIFAREEVTHDAESLGYAASDIDYTERIRKVKKEDVDRFLRNYLKDNNYTEVQLLPE